MTSLKVQYVSAARSDLEAYPPDRPGTWLNEIVCIAVPCPQRHAPVPPSDGDHTNARPDAPRRDARHVADVEGVEIDRVGTAQIDKDARELTAEIV